MEKRAVILFLLIVMLASNIKGQTEIKLSLKGGNSSGKEAISGVSFDRKVEYNYQKTIVAEFHEQLATFYKISYSDKNISFAKWLWLASGRSVIEAHVSDSGLVGDSVVGSKAFYKAKLFNDTLQLMRATGDSASVNSYLLAFIYKNTQSPLSLFAAYIYLEMNQAQPIAASKLEQLVRRQKTKFKNHYYYPLVMEKYQSLKRLQLADIKSIRCSDQAKKKCHLVFGKFDFYIIDLWFLGCVSCIEQHAEFNVVKDRFRQKNIDFIGLSIDEDVGKWSAYLRSNNYSWENYMVNDGGDLILKNFGISLFPTYLVTDRNGTILLKALIRVISITLV